MAKNDFVPTFRRGLTKEEDMRRFEIYRTSSSDKEAAGRAGLKPAGWTLWRQRRGLPSIRDAREEGSVEFDGRMFRIDVDDNGTGTTTTTVETDEIGEENDELVEFDGGASIVEALDVANLLFTRSHEMMLEAMEILDQANGITEAVRTSLFGEPSTTGTNG